MQSMTGGFNEKIDTWTECKDRDTVRNLHKYQETFTNMPAIMGRGGGVGVYYLKVKFIKKNECCGRSCN